MAKKSTLMTPDPYHIPGYCGYVPQFKYRLGGTFGAHTHGLLTDDSVASSGNHVLADTIPTLKPKRQEDCLSSSDNAADFHSFGNQKYVRQMVPGYTGYIPKGLNHFGSCYAESCHNAISAFKEDKKRYKIELEKGLSSSRLNSSLKPISSRPKPYLPMYNKQHSISPFFMPNGHPQKYFMSGYTGFIPKVQQYLGQGYPIITHHALQEHAQESEKLEASKYAPVVLERQPQCNPPLSVLYTKGQGLMPQYTGHIPGQKYKYGMTFGISTKRAVSEIAC